jgi:regulatory protein YycH of two-component signal transduction system YycFG
MVPKIRLMIITSGWSDQLIVSGRLRLRISQHACYCLALEILQVFSTHPNHTTERSKADIGGIVNWKIRDLKRWCYSFRQLNAAVQATFLHTENVRNALNNRSKIPSRNVACIIEGTTLFAQCSGGGVAAILLTVKWMLCRTIIKEHVV